MKSVEFILFINFNNDLTSKEKKVIGTNINRSFNENYIFEGGNTDV